MNEALTKDDCTEHSRRRFKVFSTLNGNTPAVQFIKDDGVYDQWLCNQAELFSVEIGKQSDEWNVRDHVKFTMKLEELKS